MCSFQQECTILTNIIYKRARQGNQKCASKLPRPCPIQLEDMTLLGSNFKHAYAVQNSHPGLRFLDMLTKTENLFTNREKYLPPDSPSHHQKRQLSKKNDRVQDCQDQKRFHTNNLFTVTLENLQSLLELKTESAKGVWEGVGACGAVSLQ
jgi:hypothetical protein